MKTILVATDFSDSASNAVEYAVELAKFFRAKLVLVNSYPVPYSSFETGGIAGDMLSVMQEASAGSLQRLKRKIEQDNTAYNFDISCYSDMGFAQDMILATAKKVNADILVLGISGDGAKLKEELIGSTAILVMRSTSIPVFCIPDHVKYHPIHKISFACDLHKTEESDLLYVSRYFGQAFGAELEIINVETPGEEFSEEKSDTCAVLDKKLETLPHKTVFITDKKAGKALEDYFAKHPTDLIMINPGKHTLFHKLFSHSVSKELAFHSKVPLLCIQ